MTPDVDLALGDDERLLRESTRKALDKAAPHKRFTAADAGGGAVDMWPLARELGWPALLVAEADGGLGLPLAAAALVAEEAGRGLFCGPLTTTAVLAPTLFGSSRLARDIAAGAMTLSLAVATDAALEIGTGDPAHVSGHIGLVEYPDVATHFLLLDLRRSGELVAAVVPAGDGRCRVLRRQAFDVTCPVAGIDFEDLAVVAGGLVRERLTEAALDDLLAPTHVAIAAELVGIARAALERAIAYARERQQFGVAIGSFQAIKHKLADAYVQVESAALAVRQAALDGDTGSALAARALASEAALKATGDCVQVHGGIGFSWECEAHLYLKRARRLVTVLDRPERQRRRIADRAVARVLGTA